MSNKWNEPKGKKQTHLKYSRKNYIGIGDTIKKLPMKKRMTEYKKWNKVFKADNPRYKQKVFKKYVGL